MGLKNIVIPAFFALSGCATTQNVSLESKKGVYQQASYSMYETINESGVSRTLDVNYDGRVYTLYDKDGDGKIESVSTKVLGIEFKFDIDNEKISEKTRKKINELYDSALSN